MQQDTFVITNETNEVVFSTSSVNELINYLNDVLNLNINKKNSIQDIDAILFTEKKLTLNCK